MSCKWKLISLALFVTNVMTILWLMHIDDERSHAEEWLGNYKHGEGVREAEKDFRAGKVRLYSIDVIPSPAIAQPIYELTNEFTGRTNGPLEIWNWRHYRPDDRLTLRLWNDYLTGYNGRMTNLYRRHILQASNNTLPGL